MLPLKLKSTRILSLVNQKVTLFHLLQFHHGLKTMQVGGQKVQLMTLHLFKEYNS